MKFSISNTVAGLWNSTMTKLIGAGDKENTIRPSIYFISIKFSDGTDLTFDKDDIIVLVGPNNAGKSATLRELEDFVKYNSGGQIVISAKIEQQGRAKDLRPYLEDNSVKIGDHPNVKYTGIGFSIDESDLKNFDEAKSRRPVAPFFCSRLSTENRLKDSDPARAIKFFREAPTRPIHLLTMDRKIADRISEMFFRGFQKYLFPFRAGGSEIPLMVGDEPDLEKDEREFDKSFVQRLFSSAAPIEKQGDGMRGFASVLLNTIVSHTQSIQLLDEPEAFLHPPQARLLGEYIAINKNKDAQLFIATHSPDILEGIISAGRPNTRIIRIQRDGNVNHIRELAKEKTRILFESSLIKYSRICEGIFYKHVIITESDADCLFYNALLHSDAISGGGFPDVLFIHSSGKHRMHQLSGALRSLGVPSSVIADIDILQDQTVLKELVETCGGEWSDIEVHWKSIKTAVEKTRPPLDAEQVKKLIITELENVGGISDFPKQSERNIKKIFQSISPWAAVKQAGRSGMSGPSAVGHFDKICSKLSCYGIWIVPVGELEGFCRSIEAGHGPSFAQKVIETRNLNSDPELKEARDFISGIWSTIK